MTDVHTEVRTLKKFADRLLRNRAFKDLINMWNECGGTCFEVELSELEEGLDEYDITQLRHIAETLTDVNEYLMTEEELSDPNFYRDIIVQEIFRRVIADLKSEVV